MRRRVAFVLLVAAVTAPLACSDSPAVVHGPAYAGGVGQGGSPVDAAAPPVIDAAMVTGDAAPRPDDAPSENDAAAAIYSEQGQTPPLKHAKPVGEWNTYEIRAVGTSYAVILNGEPVTAWSYTGDPDPAHPGFLRLRPSPGTSDFSRTRVTSRFAT